MKSPILVVGNFAEDHKGNKDINGWTLGSGGDEGYSFEELKLIAIENGTYSVAEHIEVKPLDSYGVVERNENGDVIGFTGFNTIQ